MGLNQVGRVSRPVGNKSRIDGRAGRPVLRKARVGSILLLAFSFASPWLLWGLGLAAAPIIIHLLNKRKYKETTWAAMKFLLEAVRKNARRVRIEQLALLAVRTLILVLLVSALAQPLVEQLGAFFQASQPAHKIIVLDASLSMGVQVGENSLFDRVKDVAREIVEAGRQGDVFNVVRISNLPPTVIVQTPAYQTANVIEEIEQLQLPHGRGNLADALEKVDELLKAAPDVPQKEIYLISDFQRATWLADSTDEAARVKGLLKKFEDAGHLVLVDVGQSILDNVGVTRVESQDPFVTTSRAARFRAAIRNFGKERVTGRVVEFLVDDKLVEQRAVDLNAGAEVIENFAQTFQYGGEHRVQVRLQKDRLPLDDSRWLAVPVKEQIKVLCLNGGTSGRGPGKATDFLELALSPVRIGLPGAGPPRNTIETTIVNESELPGLDLSQYDCVFVCNVRLFTDREAQLLEAYVRGGGGLVWCVGDQIQAENYNDVLYRSGEGILPAKLGDRRGDPEKRETVYTFDPGDFTHPVVEAFQGNPNAGLESTQIYAYVETSVSPTRPARVALRFDTGDAAIVEATIGRGKSVLITTAVDDRWSLWPLWPSFLPMIHEIVQFAVSGRWGERERLVGESLTEVLPSGAVEVDAAVLRPDGQIRPVPMSETEGFRHYTYEGTSLSGMYEVNFAHPVGRAELFAVNIDPRESDLTKFSAEELSEELLPSVEYTYLTSWQQPEFDEPQSPVAERGGLTRWLLYAVLYLLFVEQMLAWNFGYGLAMLFPPLILWQIARRRS